MIERLIAWRGRRNGINWFHGPVQDYAAYERLPREEQLSADEERMLVNLAKQIAKEQRLSRELPVAQGDPWVQAGANHDLPPSPLRSRATGAAFVFFAVLGVGSAINVCVAAAKGAWGPAAGFLALTGLCAYLVAPAYNGRRSH